MNPSSNDTSQGCKIPHYRNGLTSTPLARNGGVRPLVREVDLLAFHDDKSSQGKSIHTMKKKIKEINRVRLKNVSIFTVKVIRLFQDHVKTRGSMKRHPEQQKIFIRNKIQTLLNIKPIRM